MLFHIGHVSSNMFCVRAMLALRPPDKCFVVSLDIAAGFLHTGRTRQVVRVESSERPNCTKTKHHLYFTRTPQTPAILSGASGQGRHRHAWGRRVACDDLANRSKIQLQSVNVARCLTQMLTLLITVGPHALSPPEEKHATGRCARRATDIIKAGHCLANPDAQCERVLLQLLQPLLQA